MPGQLLLARSHASPHPQYAEYVTTMCLHLRQGSCQSHKHRGRAEYAHALCPGVSYSEALGSARGAHSLGPSESDSEMGDMHPHTMEEAGRKAPQKVHTGHAGPDTFHEAASSR